jgi:hypothetical protein
VCALERRHVSRRVGRLAVQVKRGLHYSQDRHVIAIPRQVIVHIQPVHNSHTRLDGNQDLRSLQGDATDQESQCPRWVRLWRRFPTSPVQWSGISGSSAPASQAGCVHLNRASDVFEHQSFGSDPDGETSIVEQSSPPAYHEEQSRVPNAPFVKGGVKVSHCGGGKGDHFFFF